MKTQITTLALSAFLLASCAQNPFSGTNTTNAEQKALMGGAIGAGIGYVTGDGTSDRLKRAAIGGTGGAVTGYGYGKYQDRQNGQYQQEPAYNNDY